MSKKKYNVELTLDELYVLNSIRRSVLDSLDWDEDLKAYTDGGRFLINLSKEEYKTLDGIIL